LLIFLRILGLQKERIEGGKEFPRKKVFFGDFDVFRSIRLSPSGRLRTPAHSPRHNLAVVTKKQPGGEEIPTLQDLLSPNISLTIRVK